MDSQRFLGLAGQGREGCRCQKGEVLLNANNLGHYDCHCIKMCRKQNILPVFLKSYHMEKKGQGGKSLANFVYLYFWNNV